MSELLEKFRSIRHIPLFPLPLVLLPNELLPLHIFEPRYRQMLKDLEGDQKFFGLSVLESADPSIAKPAIGSIGCLAEVREIHAQADGASNILVMGVLRYRLLEHIEAGDPYLVGDVEFFEDRDEDEEVLKTLASEVHELFKRVAQAAFDLSGSRGQLPEIPNSDPQGLSFLIATAFNLDNTLKYQMLEIDSTTERLTRLREILEQTVDKMEDSAQIQKVAQTNGHSKKKIDL